MAEVERYIEFTSQAQRKRFMNNGKKRIVVNHYSFNYNPPESVVPMHLVSRLQWSYYVFTLLDIHGDREGVYCGKYPGRDQRSTWRCS